MIRFISSCIDKVISCADVNPVFRISTSKSSSGSLHSARTRASSPGASVSLVENSLSDTLCGASRPGHFNGVCTVVATLFNLVLPHVAVFGEKDAQQLRVIRRMVRDLRFPVDIVPGPTLREPDGLARSSRNQYLTPAQRPQAACLRRALD